MIKCTPELERERRRAFRALLHNPLLLAEGDSAEDYLLVRRHSAWLKQWLAKFPAWSLYIDKDVVRLRKLPPDLLDDSRQAFDRTSGTAFSRRRYALLCLALAALERCERHITLGEIASTITEFACADEDLSRHEILFDIGNYDHRRDLIHVVRWLIDTGVLRKVDGDEQQFLNRNVPADVLYDINRRVLAAVLNVSSSASAMERIDPAEKPPLERVATLMDDPIPDSEDARRRRIRSRLVRILLDDPILYFHELKDEERIYLEQHRFYLMSQIQEATGLVAEVRPEGIAMGEEE